MKVLFWPYWTLANEAAGFSMTFLQNLSCEQSIAALHALAGLRTAGEPGGLEALQESEYAAKLRDQSDLWEFANFPEEKEGRGRASLLLHP